VPADAVGQPVADDHGAGIAPGGPPRLERERLPAERAAARGVRVTRPLQTGLERWRSACEAGLISDVVDLNTDSHDQDRPRLEAAAELATAQGGPISREQLMELGFGRGAIDYWLACGRLHPLFRGVYLLGH